MQSTRMSTGESSPEIILRMFRILLDRCPGGRAPSGPPWVSCRTRASGGEEYPGICR